MRQGAAQPSQLSGGKDEENAVGRSSLDDLLKRTASITPFSKAPCNASQVALPQSSGDSGITNLSDNGVYRDSLADLAIPPEAIPLPPSRGTIDCPIPSTAPVQHGLRRRKTIRKPERRRTALDQQDLEPEVHAYYLKVISLSNSRLLSSLSAVTNAQTRHPLAGRLVCYDLSTNSNLAQKVGSWKFSDWNPTFDGFRSALKPIGDEVGQRLIIVEDLSPRLIGYLGTTFNINPQFFEDHLERSGYIPDEAPKRPGGRWKVGLSASTHASLGWLRPVLPSIPVTSKFRVQLINNKHPTAQCPFVWLEHGTHPFETNTNIWRSSVYLAADPNLNSLSSGAEFPIAWTEKATVWITQIKGCRLAVLLLDPLPSVAVPAYQSQSRGPHLSGKPSHYPQFPRLPPRPPSPAAVEQLSEPGRVKVTDDAHDEGVRPLPVGLSSDHGAPPELRLREQGSVQAASVTEFDHSSLIPFTTIVQRQPSAVPVDDLLSEGQVLAFEEALQKPSSTLQDLEMWLLQSQHHAPPNSFDLVQILLKPFHTDIQCLADVIRVALRDIHEESMSEALLQQRVQYWRLLLNKYQSHIAEIERDMDKFVNFMRDKLGHFMTPATNDAVEEMKSLPPLVSDASTLLKDIRKEIENVHSSLRAEMSIIDSRRGIAGAESVSRLTELAFVFIPLSFAASVFSMQVNELRSGVPLNRFILASILILLVAYSARLMIRSSSITETINSVKEEARENAGLPEGNPLPTKILVRKVLLPLVMEFLHWILPWIWRKLYKLFASLVVLASPVVLVGAGVGALLCPIVLLWVRGINVGFKIIITLIILSLDLLLTWDVLRHLSLDDMNWDVRTWWQNLVEAQRRSHKEIQSKRRKRVVFLNLQDLEEAGVIEGGTFISPREPDPRDVPIGGGVN